MKPRDFIWERCIGDKDRTNEIMNFLRKWVEGKKKKCVCDTLEAAGYPCGMCIFNQALDDIIKDMK